VTGDSDSMMRAEHKYMLSLSPLNKLKDGLLISVIKKKVTACT
jgi:hypothetical protein